jgi:hypothetical protein
MRPGEENYGAPSLKYLLFDLLDCPSENERNKILSKVPIGLYKIDFFKTLPVLFVFYKRREQTELIEMLFKLTSQIEGIEITTTPTSQIHCSNF